MINLEDKNILITGASSGLGRELAIELDKCGSNLVLTGRNDEELQRTKNLLNNNSHRSYVFDLSKTSELETLIGKIFDNETKFDGFVHCAGIHTFLPLNFTKLDTIEEAFNVNVISPLLLIKSFAKKNNFNPLASIILISSVMGMRGSSSLSVYSSSKAAQIGLAKSLAVELSKKQIKVNSISASMLSSKILDKVKSKTSIDAYEEIEKKHLLGLGKYEDVIPSILFLLSDKTQWITGSNMVVDGGYSSW